MEGMETEKRVVREEEGEERTIDEGKAGCD